MIRFAVFPYSTIISLHMDEDMEPVHTAPIFFFCRILRGRCSARRAFISFSMFGGLITGMVAAAVSAVAEEDRVTELRMRVGRPLVVLTAEGRRIAKLPSGAPFSVRREDVERVLAVASDFSVYAVNEQLVRGYVSRRGIRIGVAGEGVVEEGRMLTMKHIAFLTLRVPHEVKGGAERVRGAVFGDGVKNTLVISPPYGGKTTLLRELARLSSFSRDTLIIDERFELAAAEEGVPTLDVGDCDVVSGVDKLAAYENTIRAMHPEVIVTDELFRGSEAEAVCDMVRSGVKVFASLHGRGAESVFRSPIFGRLAEVMEVYIVLSPHPVAGTVTEVLTAEEAAKRAS